MLGIYFLADELLVSQERLFHGFMSLLSLGNILQPGSRSVPCACKLPEYFYVCTQFALDSRAVVTLGMAHKVFSVSQQIWEP